MKIIAIFFYILILIYSCSNGIKINRINNLILDSVITNNYNVLSNITYNNKNCILYVDKLGLFKIFDQYGKLIKRVNLNNYINDNWYIKERIGCDIFLTTIQNDKTFYISNAKEISYLNIKNNDYKKYSICNSILPDNKWELFSMHKAPFIKINDSTFLISTMRYIDVSTQKGRKMFYNYPFLAILKINKDKIPQLSET